MSEPARTFPSVQHVVDALSAPPLTLADIEAGNRAWDATWAKHQPDVLDEHLADSPCSGCRAGCDDCARQLEDDDLPSHVFQALGAASACWENLEGAGVFQSDRALDIGEKLLARIEKARETAPATADLDTLATEEQLAALRARLTKMGDRLPDVDPDPFGHGPVPCTAPTDQARAHLADAAFALGDLRVSLIEAGDSAYALVTSLWFAAAAVNTAAQRAVADRVIGLVLHRRETAQ